MNGCHAIVILEHYVIAWLNYNTASTGFLQNLPVFDWLNLFGHKIVEGFVYWELQESVLSGCLHFTVTCTLKESNNFDKTLAIDSSLRHHYQSYVSG